MQTKKTVEKNQFGILIKLFEEEEKTCKSILYKINNNCPHKITFTFQELTKIKSLVYLEDYRAVKMQREAASLLVNNILGAEHD